MDKIHTIKKKKLVLTKQKFENNGEQIKKRLASVVMRYNLPIILSLVLIEIVTLVYLEDKTLIALISASIGSITTALINERLMLIQYFFGSSKGSEDKQKSIDKKLNEK